MTAQRYRPASRTTIIVRYLVVMNQRSIDRVVKPRVAPKMMIASTNHPSIEPPPPDVAGDGDGDGTGVEEIVSVALELVTLPS